MYITSKVNKTLVLVNGQQVFHHSVTTATPSDQGKIDHTYGSQLTPKPNRQLIVVILNLPLTAINVEIAKDVLKKLHPNVCRQLKKFSIVPKYVVLPITPGG